LWFEEGSPFLARLSAELGVILHKLTPLLWSGANSIFVRDKTAHALAEHLAAEHAEHPQATQLVIAHSHGGNIALRALHHLDRAEGANPLVVTLATPFIEIHQADLGLFPLAIRTAVFLAIQWFAMAVFTDYTPDLGDDIIWELLFGSGLLFIAGLTLWWGFWWIGRKATRRKQIERLSDATRLSKALGQRLSIIRAIDDEASLVLALGAFFNYLCTHLIAYVAFSLFVLHIIIFTVGIIINNTSLVWRPFSISFANLGIAVSGTSAVITILIFGMLMVSRSVHGRELSLSPMECQINTQSTPDAIGLSRIVTLVRRTYVKSLRHGIYDHEDCAKTISDWVRSQLDHVPSS
jgi:hypothetical protein